MERLRNWLQQASDTAVGWLSSPAALSQFALLILAGLVAHRFSPVIERTLLPSGEAKHPIAPLRRFAVLFAALALVRKSTFSAAYHRGANDKRDIIARVVSILPFVLQSPDASDCELRAVGVSSVDFAVEYGVAGIGMPCRHPLVELGNAPAA